MLTAIFLICTLLFLGAYFTYGRFLERLLGIDNTRPTPSHTEYDGVDRVPAHPAVLFGHHFSSIAGAGPIVGPIIAAVAFGWAVPLVWVLHRGDLHWWCSRFRCVDGFSPQSGRGRSPTSPASPCRRWRTGCC